MIKFVVISSLTVLFLISDTGARPDPEIVHGADCCSTEPTKDACPWESNCKNPDGDWTHEGHQGGCCTSYQIPQEDIEKGCPWKYNCKNPNRKPEETWAASLLKKQKR